MTDRTRTLCAAALVLLGACATPDLDAPNAKDRSRALGDMWAWQVRRELDRVGAIALSDPDHWVRVDAINALQRTGDPRVLPYLVQVLERGFDLEQAEHSASLSAAARVLADPDLDPSCAHLRRFVDHAEQRIVRRFAADAASRAPHCQDQ